MLRRTHSVAVGQLSLLKAPEPAEEERTDVVFVDEPMLLEAQNFISGCEHCTPETAKMTFDYLLDAITGCDPTVTEYVICCAARCPRCQHEVMEKTSIISE